jgi:Protein of unknown function (DUF2793)
VTTPIVKLVELNPTTQERIIINSDLRHIEALLGSVDAFQLNTPPASPAEGYKAIVGTAPTGVWTGFANHLALYFGGAYTMVPPSTKIGRQVAASSGDSYRFDGTNWVVVAGGSGTSVVPTVETAATVAPALNAKVISNYSGTRQTITTPTAALGSLTVYGKSTGGYQIQGGTYIFQNGSSNTGVRNLTATARYAVANLMCIDVATNLWLCDPSTGLELFDPNLVLRPDTTAVVNAFIAAGYSPTASEQTAINAFYAATDTLRSAVAREYGFMGTTAATQLLNWVNPGTNGLTSTNVTYSAIGATTAAGGSLNTGFTVTTAQQNNFAFGVYLTAVPAASNFLAGSSRFGSGYFLRTGTAGNLSGGDLGTNVGLTTAHAKGWLAVSRTGAGAGASNARFNATTGTGASASAPSSGYLDTTQSNILLGAEFNNGGVSGGGASLGHAVIFNRGLTASELQTYGNAVTTLQTSLSRN